MDYTYQTIDTKLGEQTTISDGISNYSQILPQNGSTIRTVNWEASRLTTLHKRAFKDNKPSYQLFAQLTERLMALSGTDIPHKPVDFEHYMNEGLSIELPSISAEVKININDASLPSAIESHIERSSSKWGFATDAISAITLAAIIKRPVTFEIYGAFLAVVDLAIGLVFGSWKYAPTHAMGYLPARKIHKDEILDKPAALVESYKAKINRFDVISHSVGHSQKMVLLEQEIENHFQMIGGLFRATPHQKGLVISIRDGPGTETAMSTFEKLLAPKEENVHK